MSAETSGGNARQVVSRIGFTVGDRDAQGHPVESTVLEKAIDYLKNTLAQYCGGAQVSSQPGVYRHTDGSVVEEHSVTVWAFSLGSPIDIPTLRRHARYVCALLNQEATLLAVERVAGSIEFVGPEARDDEQQAA